jgi:hypothetical protein
MQLNSIRRENADPHHGEADRAASNFVPQEPIQLHQRNKSWSYALAIKVHVSRTAQLLQITNVMVKNDADLTNCQ